MWEIFSNFAAFLEYMNFYSSLWIPMWVIFVAISDYMIFKT